MGTYTEDQNILKDLWTVTWRDVTPCHLFVKTRCCWLLPRNTGYYQVSRSSETPGYPVISNVPMTFFLR
eukprot:858414-Amorphochlora_amoeboformis.AAC.1